MNRNMRRIWKDYQELVHDPIERIHYVQDEDNLTLGYALIIGPEDTPYADGYYLFEFTFPDNYPFHPPKVKFITYDGFTRFNPNLYIDGQVCLSILNTWPGEKWSACQSIRTILLTLSTLLNTMPLLNEPGIKPDNLFIQPYNQLIEFKNIEVAILKYLEKTNLPFAFHCFHPVMVEHFQRVYPSLVQRFQDKPTHPITVTVRVFENNNGVTLNYVNLVRLMSIVYNDLNRKA
jgi:ubiquitin-conjugating enzyme E2 Z